MKLSALLIALALTSCTTTTTTAPDGTVTKVESVDKDALAAAQATALLLAERNSGK
jgi:hypothetical protein